MWLLLPDLHSTGISESPNVLFLPQIVQGGGASIARQVIGHDPETFNSWNAIICSWEWWIAALWETTFQALLALSNVLTTQSHCWGNMAALRPKFVCHDFRHMITLGTVISLGWMHSTQLCEAQEGRGSEGTESESVLLPKKGDSHKEFDLTFQPIQTRQ